MAQPRNVLAMIGGPLVYPVDGPPRLIPPDPRLGTALRAAIRSLTVMQKEALVASSRTGRTWRLVSDEGAYLNGHDAAPPPLAFLSAGMVASYMTEIAALARSRGIDVSGLDLRQHNFYTMKGSALQGTMTGGARDVELDVRMDCGADLDAVRTLVLDAVAASPLNGLMRAQIESRFTLAHNGSPLEPVKALPVQGPRVDLPPGAFDAIAPEPGDWAHALVHTGELSPIVAETVTLVGDALTESQDRILHVEVRARRRADGMLDIAQHLHNPQGSMFRFRTDEAGRAPDAETLIAAGIGFCFMTQLGRYAKIAKVPLGDYAVVQDTHFSLAGASDGTGRAGTADPVETHVHLTSQGDDAFARAALDMAEQTCFLHAFCRTALKAKVRVTRAAVAA